MREEAPNSPVDQLDRKVVFPFSAGVLRVVAAGSLALVALGVLAVLYLSFPRPEPAAPPELAAPALPAKPAVKAADLGSPVQPVARLSPVAALREAERRDEAPAPTADEVALDAHLAKYRTLAEQLRLPWDSVRKTVCDAAFYGNCYSTKTIVTKLGMADLLDGNLLGDAKEAKQKDRILTAAEGLYAAIAGQGATTADVFSLTAPPQPARGARPATVDASGAPVADGDGLFRALFLAPARALRTEFRKVQRATPDFLPEAQRAGLVEDMYPGALAIVKEVGGEPAARAKAVEQFAETFAAMERARLASSVDLLTQYNRALRAREAEIDAARAAYEVEALSRKTRRIATLYSVGVCLLAAISVGVLLALLAIERHMRVLRTVALRGITSAGEIATPERIPAQRIEG